MRGLSFYQFVGEQFQIMSDVVRHTATNRKTKASAMKGFVADIEELTEENSDFRRVLCTGKACASG